jgi:hypothetical protein
MVLASDPLLGGNFRMTRIATRLVWRPRTDPKLDMFYGYPAEFVVELCSVAVSTAHAPRNAGGGLSRETRS